MSPAEEIKSRLDIVEVISGYFPLKQAGANWRARCPFHDERTPSFMVSKAKQIWHCFGCGEGGDIFSFVMKQEGLEFPDALRLLADKAGVMLKSEDPALRSERQRLYELLEAAVIFWSELLWQKSSETARRYLIQERQLKEDTIRAWRLGYAPDSWEALINRLSDLGYKEEEMIKSGLAVRKMEMRGRGAYDRFRNRIIFPVAGAQGRIIGVSGRILDSAPIEAPAQGSSPAQGLNPRPISLGMRSLPVRQAGAPGGKYINTPETLIYHKGQILYGLDKAKTAVKQENLAIIVEGNMDAIVSHQAGVANVVASSGTALTAEQVRLLKRYTENLAFAFDADTAGESATMRGLMTALSEGCQVLLIRLPVGPDGRRLKDPDECIRANPDLWRQAIASAEPMMEHYFGRVVSEYDLSKLTDKQKAVKLLLSLISRLAEPIAFNHYLKKLANLVDVPERYLRDALSLSTKSAAPANQPVSSTRTSAGAASLPSQRGGRAVQSERLLAALLASPRQMAFTVGNLAPEMLDSEYAALYRAMIVFYTEHGENGTINWRGTDFSAYLKNYEDGGALASQLDVLSLLADKEFADLDTAGIEQEVLSVVSRLKKMHLKSILQNIENNIRAIEHSSPQDKDKLSALFVEFKTVSGELAKIDNQKNSKKSL